MGFFGRTWIAHIALLALCVTESAHALTVPKGCAATPFEKQKIAVFGSAGELGGLTFGFLQRAVSLYGTGVGAVRCIGATADTAVRLNRLLSRNFCLAVADESCIKLTDLQSVEAIQERLETQDAVIWGTDVSLQQRTVTAGTYEKTPNDRAFEVYWGDSRGVVEVGEDATAVKTSKASLLENILQASRQAKIKHMVVVQDENTKDWLPALKTAGVPYTYIRLAGAVTDTKNYTYRNGIQGSLSISVMADDDAPLASSSSSPISKEDVAALCVQCLQSLDWTRSRCLQVSCNGPLDVAALPPSTKRPDQEWVVRSSVLEDALANIA